MRIPTALLRRKLFFLLIPSLIGVAYLGSTVFPSSPKKEKTIVRVNNLTRSCDLSVEKHKDHLRLSVQNNSNKAVTAFVITSPIDSQTVFTHREEFAFSEGDDVISPGQGYAQEIWIPGNSSNQTAIILNLSSVIFEDGSTEGDPQTVRDTVESRLGRKIQILKVLPVLEQMAQLSDDELNLYWNQTAKQNLEDALNLPNKDSFLKLNQKLLSNNGLYNESEQFKSGVQVGKDTILQKYQQLKDVQEKQGIRTLRDRIIYLRHLYIKMINRP